MTKTTVRLTIAQKRALQGVARATGRSQADLIRDGVDLVIARYRTSEPRLPLFTSGRPDLTEELGAALEGFGER